MGTIIDRGRLRGRSSTGDARRRPGCKSARAHAVPLSGHDAPHCRPAPAGPARLRAPNVRGPHPRLPDERPRLRAPRRAARDGRLRRPRQLAARASAPTSPTSSSSTPARCARTPTTSSTATSASCARPRPRNPDMQIAVGGCLAQKDRDDHRRSARRGSTSSSAPTTSAACRPCSTGPGTTARRRSRSSSRSRPSPRRCRPDATPPTPAGCRSRSAATTRAPSASSRACAARSRTAARATSSPRSEALVDEGVVEVTLLGQNVNTYGVEFGDRLAFGKLLRACGEIEGLERVRFTSPHPAAFTDDVIEAMAADAQRHAEPAHAAAVRLRPRAAGRCAAPTAARSSSASSTRSARRSRTPRSPPTSSSASPARPRTTSRRRCASSSSRGSRAPSPSSTRSAPAPPPRRCPTRCPRPSSRSASSGSSRCRSEIAWAENRAFEGREVEVLVAPGEGRKDAATDRMSGRARDNRLVHFAVPPAARERGVPRPGDVVDGRGHLRRAAPPRRRRCVAWRSLRRTSHAGRRFLGGDAGQPGPWPTNGRAGAPPGRRPAAAAGRG